MPKKTAKEWIDNGRLTLLLDGLDEIAPSSDFMLGTDDHEATLDEQAVDLRSACINAINDYQASHPNVDIVVCSRIRDYEALTRKNSTSHSAILLTCPNR